MMARNDGEDGIGRMNASWIKLGAILGIIAPLIALSCIGIAVMLTPWFSWTDNFLSDLAGPDNIGNSAFAVFNVGLIVAGLLGMLFGWTLRESRILKRGLGNLAVILLILDMAFLWAIGVFPETSGAFHFAVSASFFILLPFVQLFAGISIYKWSEKRIGFVMLLTAAISFVAFPLFLMEPPVGSNAIAEIIPAISYAISSIVLGLSLLSHVGRIQGNADGERLEDRELEGAENNPDKEGFE